MIRSAGNVIPAAGRDIHHKYDHRLARSLFESQDFTVHDVAGRHRAAGRIEAQNDRLNILVLVCRFQLLVQFALTSC